MSNPEQGNPRHYLSFWNQLLEKARLQTSLFRSVTAPPGPELSVQQGAVRWSLVLSDDSALVAIQVSEKSPENPGPIASALLSHRTEIELACGTRLVWHQSQGEEGSLCAIVWRVEDYGFAITGDWPYLQDTLVAAVARLHRACRPFLSGGNEALPPRRVSETDLEQLAELFTHEMINSFYVLGEETGYWANYFLRSVRQHGGVEAARRLLNQPQPSDELERLRKIHRLDISVEAYVLRPEYALLFTSDELAIARRRLRDYDYPI